MDELREKLECLEHLRSARGLDGLLLARNENIAWASGGARSHIVLSQETGVGALLYDGTGLRLLTSSIELGRLVDEELTGFDARPLVAPWYADWLADGIRASGLTRLGADILLPGAVDCAAEIAALRTPLLDAECERFRALGRDAAEALEASARAVRVGDTEYQIAARTAANCIERGIDPIVALVSTDDRIERVRHPLPTAKRIAERAMLVVCGRRGGLVANATRFVQIGTVAADLLDRQAACARIAAAFLAATRPGATAGQVFAAGLAAYAAEGYPDDWHALHQGGAGGYLSREWLGTPGGSQTITPPQAFAWNPSLPGIKIEDTVLLTGSGIEVLTDTGNWPRIEASAGGHSYRFATILELPRS